MSLFCSFGSLALLSWSASSRKRSRSRSFVRNPLSRRSAMTLLALIRRLLTIARTLRATPTGRETLWRTLIAVFELAMHQRYTRMHQNAPHGTARGTSRQSSLTDAVDRNRRLVRRFQIFGRMRLARGQFPTVSRAVREGPSRELLRPEVSFDAGLVAAHHVCHESHTFVSMHLCWRDACNKATAMGRELIPQAHARSEPSGAPRLSPSGDDLVDGFNRCAGRLSA